MLQNLSKIRHSYFPIVLVLKMVLLLKITLIFLLLSIRLMIVTTNSRYCTVIQNFQVQNKIDTFFFPLKRGWDSFAKKSQQYHWTLQVCLRLHFNNIYIIKLYKVFFLILIVKIKQDQNIFKKIKMHEMMNGEWFLINKQYFPTSFIDCFSEEKQYIWTTQKYYLHCSSRY